MSAFEDSLYDWKAREEHADALILLQDHQLLKYAGLWRPTLLQRVDGWPMDGSWSELWACVSLNFKLLADMADETENRARFQLRRLTEMRLIYPDGARACTATRVVIKFIASALA